MVIKQQLKKANYIHCGNDKKHIKELSWFGFD